MKIMSARPRVSLAAVATALFVATSHAEPPSATAITASPETKLQKKEIGAIRPLHVYGDIYLAGQPQPDDLALLKREGIKTVITLRKRQEVPWDQAAEVEKHGMKFIEVPFGAPDELKPEVFDKILKVLRDKKRGPTVVHCGAANRVGGIWYAYRVLDGNQTPAAALEEAKKVGLRTPGYLDQAKAYVEQARKKGS